MKSCCLKCRKNTERVHSEICETSNGKTMILSKCKVCGAEKSRFIKNQEAKGLLSYFGLSQIGLPLF